MVIISIGGILLKNVDKYLYQAKNNGKDVSCLDGNLL